jgi:hypothetical protein
LSDPNHIIDIVLSIGDGFEQENVVQRNCPDGEIVLIEQVATAINHRLRQSDDAGDLLVKHVEPT